MSIRNLRSKQLQLGGLQRRSKNGPKHSGKIGRGNGRDEGCYVRVSRAQSGDGSVPKIIPVVYQLDLAQGGIACSDDRYGVNVVLFVEER